jgi:hypothetical protein
MLDKTELLKRTAAYAKAHPPDTGYTVSAMKAVLQAGLPAGANLLVQFAMQFTGKEESTDYAHWDKPEIRLPYSNTYRYSLDRSADCSSFWWAVYNIFFGVNIGTTTWKMYDKWHRKFIPWEKRRPGDVILYNFKSGRPVSHAAGYIGGGLIQHTTNPRDKMHIEADTYAAKNRVGVFRPVSGEQYSSLIVGGQEVTDMNIKKGDKNVDVERVQWALVVLGYTGNMDISLIGPEPFGSNTEKSVIAFQESNGLPVTGVVDDATFSMLLAKAVEKIQKDNVCFNAIDNAMKKR